MRGPKAHLPSAVENEAGAEEASIKLPTITLYPAWRSQAGNLFLFAVTAILAVQISKNVAWSVVHGQLFAIGDAKIFLSLPLAALVPLFFLVRAFAAIYDAVYLVDDSGVEARIGYASTMFRRPRLRLEDIRGVEPVQTILQRVLGIGDVLVGSAMTEGVEIVMEGVADPCGVQQLISERMEARIKTLRADGELDSAHGD